MVNIAFDICCGRGCGACDGGCGTACCCGAMRRMYAFARWCRRATSATGGQAWSAACCPGDCVASEASPAPFGSSIALGSIVAVGVVLAIAFDIWVMGGRPCGWEGRTGGFIRTGGFTRTYKTLGGGASEGGMTYSGTTCDQGTWENGGVGTGTLEGGATEGGRTYRGTTCGLGTSLRSGTIMSWETKRQLVGMGHKGREDRITGSIS